MTTQAEQPRGPEREPEDDERDVERDVGESHVAAAGPAASKAAASEVEEWERLLTSGTDPQVDRGVQADGDGRADGDDQGDADEQADRDDHVDDGPSSGVTPADLLRAALTNLGMDEATAQGWLSILCAKVAIDGTEGEGVPVPTTDAEVVGVLRLMAGATSSLEASALITVQDLVLRTASRLLASHAADDLASMSRTARRTWRAQVKASVAGELQVALGIGVVEARQMVAVGTSPGVIRLPILQALQRGEVCWRLVREFQRKTRRLTVEQAARVSVAMYGTDEERAAVERLDPDGRLDLGRPWHHAEYYDALAREIAHVKDDDEAEADRAAALEARDTRLDLEDDGTATFSCTTSLATGVAIARRIDSAARRARKGGDPRTLAQLRSDITAALLIYGTVTALGKPTVGENDRALAEEVAAEMADETITPDDIEALQAIITATPAGHVDLIVPWDTLLGAVCARCRDEVVPTGSSAEPGAGSATEPPPQSQAQGDSCACRAGGSDAEQRDDGPQHGQHRANSADAAEPGQHRANDLDTATEKDTKPSGHGRGVGELIGWQSAFVSARDARQIFLTPGTRLSRVLVDPADGRCIERMIGSYEPDTDMKRQVRAADVYGRGPGCRRPARDCEIDHEVEWLTSRWTAEPNLNCKACLDHFRKTKGLWRSLMNPRRDVTWTTLLGQVTTTRGHDYRQYLARIDDLAPYDPADSHHEGVWPGDRSDLAARRDLVNQVLYAAIVHRDPGDRAEAEDDIVDSEDWLVVVDWVHLHHRDEDGRRRPGPAPDQPTPETVLGMHGTQDQDLTKTDGSQPGTTTDQGPATTRGSQPGSRADEATRTTDGSRQGTTSDDEAPGPQTRWGKGIRDRSDEEPPPF